MGGDIVDADVVIQNGRSICFNVRMGVKGGLSGKQSPVWCWNWCCSNKSDPSGHTLTVLTDGFTCLMRGKYLGSRNSERWSDWLCKPPECLYTRGLVYCLLWWGRRHGILERKKSDLSKIPCNNKSTTRMCCLLIVTCSSFIASLALASGGI